MMSKEEAKRFAEQWGVSLPNYKSQPLAPITYIGMDDTEPAVERVNAFFPEPIQANAREIDVVSSAGVKEAGSVMYDPVHHPLHYKQHPSGVECIDITEHMSFCLGNAVKYIWRADLKGSSIQDLEKAKWYLEREIKRRESAQYGNS